MSELALQVQNLSKRYRISYSGGEKNGGGSALRTLMSPFRYLISTLHEPAPSEIIWALKDVSFEVKAGEVLGILGRNGAGKSTLLKILSRITEPSSGRALVNGRVGSLLEVGTGFHPELSGRENIYLSGAILGMRKEEIDRKFDEIVDFAEVEQFIDMPVKRYSSGMYVRLAFSVAAYLEPDILLVDEVLAVGDVAFQQKCLTRIKSLTSDGMTILLVSHNLAAIQSSCNRAIFLLKGELVEDGPTLDVIQRYQMSLQNRNGQQGELVRGTSQGVSIVGFDMFGADGISRRNFEFGESVRIRIDLDAHQRLEHPMINLGIKRADGVVICNFNNWYDNFKIDYIEGLCSLEGWLPPLRMVPDFYEIHVLVWHWGGGHLVGDMTRSQPLAWSTFGDFTISGPGLNSHDGVYQVPALKWRLQQGEGSIEFDDIGPSNIYEAFE
jgi:homopolymeric O-antigen transport system ATP-binding protein